MKKAIFSLLLGAAVLIFSAGAEAAWKVNSLDFIHPNEKVSGLIPQIENEDQSEKLSNLNDTFQINVERHLEEAMKAADPERPDHFQFQTKYEIPYNTDRYISVIQQYYAFTGGAHGNTFYDIGTYDMKKGTVVTLNDVFAPKVNYSKLLTRIVRKQIKEQGKSDQYRYFKVVEPDVQFYLSPEGLVILYPPYGIAPYVEGTIRFVIPWEEIRSKLNPDFDIEEVK